MPKKNIQGGQNNALDNQPYLLEEIQDFEAEVEENVGVAPRKVSEEDVVNAEKAFNQMVEGEEIEFETIPFRPGRDDKFLLTKFQKDMLNGGIKQLDTYFKKEDRAGRSSDILEDNKRLRDLLMAMKKIVADGLDSLNPEERKTVDEDNDSMDATYRADTYENGKKRSLSEHIDNFAGPHEINPSRIHGAMDMLGVLTGKPATYTGNEANGRLKSRARSRKEKTVDKKVSMQPDEVQDLRNTAEQVKIKDLQAQFGDTEIGKKLGQINNIVKDLDPSNYRLIGAFEIEEHLKEADGLGPFLNTKDETGKTNYEKITEKLLGKDKTNERKKAFDRLLGQLNIVCDLDINVPDAVEAQEAYEWDKKQKGIADAPRIEKLNDRIYKQKLVNAWHTDFLDSLQTLVAKTRVVNQRLSDGNIYSGKVTNTILGLNGFIRNVKGNNRLNKLDTESEQLATMLDLGKTLQGKDGDKTLYDLLAAAYADGETEPGEGKKKLDATLQEMNERMGLKIVIPGQEVKGGKAQKEQVTQHAPYVNAIKEVQHSTRRMDKPDHLKFALANVLALRRMSVDPAHEGHKRVRGKAVIAKAKELMDTKAFKELTKDMTVLDLAKKIYHPGNFDKDFTQKLKTMDLAEYQKRLEDKTYKNKLKACAKNSAKVMNETGTGVYWLGLRRKSNSGMYDRAILAMEAAANNPDAATTMRSVQSVKEYLSNKMTKRSSTSGQKRWQSCMEFLHEAMTPDEFREYCNEVNKARNAKEGSDDFVRPMDFNPAPQRLSAPGELQQVADRENKLGAPEPGPDSGRRSI